MHLVGTMLARIGSSAAQRHTAIGARSLGRLHHLFVLGSPVLEPDFHLQIKRLQLISLIVRMVYGYRAI